MTDSDALTRINKAGRYSRITGRNPANETLAFPVRFLSFSRIVGDPVQAWRMEDSDAIAIADAGPYRDLAVRALTENVLLNLHVSPSLPPSLSLARAPSASR